MDGIEQFLRILDDGRWHELDDVASRLGWTFARTKRLAGFLSEHGLVHFRSRDDFVKIDHELLDLMRET